jgi:hypothetical protein
MEWRKIMESCKSQNCISQTSNHTRYRKIKRSAIEREITSRETSGIRSTSVTDVISKAKWGTPVAGLKIVSYTAVYNHKVEQREISTCQRKKLFFSNEDVIEIEPVEEIKHETSVHA